MVGGILLVLVAQQRLQQPEVHRAIGRMLGEPAEAAVGAGNDDGLA